MKKWLCLALCLFLALPVFAVAEDKVVNVYTWETYISDAVIADFTKATGIKVNYSPISSNDEMLAKMQMNGGSEYDILIVSDYTLNIMRKEGLLMKLNKELLPNWKNLDPSYLGQYYDPQDEYAVPYTAGSPMIVYDPAAVEKPITALNDLWDESLQDSVVILDDARNMIGVTLKTLGYSMNETDPAKLEEAKEKLNELYPNIRAFDYDTPYTLLIQGEATVGYMFTPYVLIAQAERPDLVAVSPAEGAGFGIDNLVIPVNAPNPENAHALINYLLDGEIAARTVIDQSYMNPNLAAEAYLPEGYLDNPVFITPEQIEKAEFITDIGETEAVYQQIWQEFKLQ